MTILYRKIPAIWIRLAGQAPRAEVMLRPQRDLPNMVSYCHLLHSIIPIHLPLNITLTFLLPMNWKAIRVIKLWERRLSSLRMCCLNRIMPLCWKALFLLHRHTEWFLICPVWTMITIIVITLQVVIAAMAVHALLRKAGGETSGLFPVCGIWVVNLLWRLWSRYWTMWKSVLLMVSMVISRELFTDIWGYTVMGRTIWGQQVHTSLLKPIPNWNGKRTIIWILGLAWLLLTVSLWISNTTTAIQRTCFIIALSVPLPVFWIILQISVSLTTKGWSSNCVQLILPVLTSTGHRCWTWHITVIKSWHWTEI